MTTREFGAPVLRKEDARLVSGNGRYLDDLGHHARAAAFVRSPHAHARIVDIDVTDALDVEGLVAIYTWEDLPGKVGEPLPLLIPHPALHAPKTGYALAKDVVNHVGEPVAMVVAHDRYVAEDAAARIRVTYDVLPAVVGVDAARRADHAVHDDIPDNIAARMLQEVGDAEAAIAAAPHVLELDLDIERSASTPMECRGVLARWDADEGSLRIYSSTQTTTGVRAAVAAKLDLPLAKVDCIAPDVGGGFGVKIMHPWPEEVLVSWVAKRLGGEVKFVEDRREHFVASSHERQQLHEIRVGFDDEGRLLGLDVKIWHDNGAYTPYGIIVPIITSTQLLGPYKPGAYRVEFWSLYTTTVIVTPYRGAGRPQAAFAIERTMDAIADYLGLDRAVVRETNFIRPDEMPYDHQMIFQDGRPLIYDSGDFPASLEKLKKLVGWDDFEAFRVQARAEGRQVGIGLACYVEGTGVGPYEGGHVQVETSGRVNVSTGLTTQGQGHQTAFAQIVADELGVAIDDVFVTTGDTRRFRYSVGTFASRAAVMSGNAVALAARKVREKALRIAGDALEADPGDLEIVEGVVRVKGHPDASIPLGTVAVLSNPLRYAFDDASRAATQFAVGDTSKPPVAEDDEPGLEGVDYYSPPHSTFANGMHAVVVETDVETAEIKVLRYCVVHDCGPLINPMIVEGQVHGGVAQGVGGALYERMHYDENGQLLNASFMDFLIPYATEVPRIETDHLETPSPLNPLGIKGAGEAGVIPAAAAFASAIEDAEGFRITRMPISPSELFHLRERFAAGEIAPVRRAAPAAAGDVTSVAAEAHTSAARFSPYDEKGLPVKVKGDATLHAPVEAVWKALNDPAVLVRTIPGCEQLEEVGPDRYRMTITAGVASIKGTYQGDVALSDQNPPGSFVLKASGAGAPGTMSADVKVSLADDGSGGTRLDYDADAIVGGMIGGVGQRMLTGVAKKTAGEFFTAVDDVLTGKAIAEPAAVASAAQEPGAAPTVFRAPPGPPSVVGGQDFMKGAVFGAVVALLGALIGGLIARRRT